jgi:hypothetical protein
MDDGFYLKRFPSVFVDSNQLAQHAASFAFCLTTGLDF